MEMQVVKRQGNNLTKTNKFHIKRKDRKVSKRVKRRRSLKTFNKFSLVKVVLIKSYVTSVVEKYCRAFCSYASIQYINICYRNNRKCCSSIKGIHCIPLLILKFKR